MLFFVLFFCDFLVPSLTCANQPKWGFIGEVCFFLHEGHITLVQKNYHTKPCHFGTYTKKFSFRGPICTEIWHFKVGWFWGGGNHLMIVQCGVRLCIMLGVRVRNMIRLGSGSCSESWFGSCLGSLSGSSLGSGSG